MKFQNISDNVEIGPNVFLAEFINLYGCKIGEGSKVGAFVEIQCNAEIGRNCKISSHSFICEGVLIEDDVFIGHSVTFINDKNPRATNADHTSQTAADWVVIPTIVKRGASIGSGSTIMCGVTIGEDAVVGAGSLVLANVENATTVAGNPARVLKRQYENVK